jgi:hypothetical protein
MNVNVNSVSNLLNDLIKQRFQVTILRAAAEAITEFRFNYMGQLLVYASAPEDAGPEAIGLIANKFLDECRDMLDQTFVKRDEEK